MSLSHIPFLAVLVVLTAVAACGCMSQETVVTGEEAAAVLAYADPIADNLMQGFNEGDYAKYSRDFSPEMKQALDEAAFEQNREAVTSRIGLYESRSDPVVTETGEYIAVTYRAAFEGEDGVALRFVFKKDDPSHQLHGLWFNSPKLRS
jgi:isocitrate dehydrogenase kinase/phosphatase